MKMKKLLAIVGAFAAGGLTILISYSGQIAEAGRELN
jgi:hypothetical protein